MKQHPRELLSPWLWTGKREGGRYPEGLCQCRTRAVLSSLASSEIKGTYTLATIACYLPPVRGKHNDPRVKEDLRNILLYSRREHVAILLDMW